MDAPEALPDDGKVNRLVWSWACNLAEFAKSAFWVALAYQIYQHGLPFMN